MNKVNELSIENILEQRNEIVEKYIKEAPMYGVIIVGDQSYDLQEWLTLKNYSVKNKCEINTISNWVTRGAIGPADRVIIPQLNNLVLIRDKKYK